MNTGSISFLRINRAPALAAAAVICLSFTPNTLAGVANTASAVRAGIFASQPSYEKGEVLTHQDELLYRSIFAAQAEGYWRDADRIIPHLTDKRLMGHVLADRYQRHGANLAELEAWLAAYHDLPEADDLYEQAEQLPASKDAKLARPVAAGNLLSGGFAYGTASGFHNRKEHPVAKGVSKDANRVLNHIGRALHKGDPIAAKTLLEATVQRTPLPRDVLLSLQSQLAAGYFYKGKTDEARRLTEASYMQNNPRALWINGLSNFSEARYAAAGTAFATLANRDDLADSDHTAAAFWAYRALLRAGNKNEADRWLAEAANEPRSFYGFLANNLMGHGAETSWSWHLPEFNQRTVNSLANLPAGARALALVQIGQNDLAESELRSLNPQGRHALQEAMLTLAEKGHMASLALKLGGMAVNGEGKPYDAALYPVPSWQPKDGFQVDRALIYALMRHESQFDPLAVSSQGACGLMQLMPATAARIDGTRHKSVDGECPDQLFDPAVNLGLGQRYVRQLADQPMIGDNLLLLLTAYNAGPGRLSKQTGLDEAADPLLFIESLPAQETHDYVQQVLMQYWGYRARLHQPLKSLDQLAHGQWPRYALHDLPPAREASILNPAEAFTVASNVIAH
jgi:soluble lytic murein transglycosylase